MAFQSSVITFIQNIKMEDLTIDKTHFDAHMEACEAEVRQRGWNQPQHNNRNSDANNRALPTHKPGLLPSNMLMASAEMFTKSISSLINPSDEAPSDSASAENSSQSQQNQADFTEDQVNEAFGQLSEIFPSLDKDIMRDIIVMNKADFEASLDVCLQLVNDN
ncbi:hypothetical protein JCM33374_g3259 [Metschnikowia sp. JCM 33374]|nr:hypothetical protein JCM33374_g3259 [Metschnikowia sp. JCM 33374]